MAAERSITGNRQKETLENFRKYLVPSMLSMMLMAVYTFTDTFVVGQKLGAVALGAMGVCTPVLTVTYAFGFLFGMGGCSRYAIAVGQNNREKADRIFSTAVFATIVFGVAAAVILNLFARPFAFFLGANSSNIQYVMSYLRVMLVYIPGFMMDIVMLCFMKNEDHPTIAMIATITGTGMNVALDFLFVFGFGWGMFGAAFATALCSGLGCGLNIVFAYAEKMHMTYKVMPDLPDSIPEDPAKVLMVSLDEHDRLEQFRQDISGWAKGRISVFFSNQWYLEFVREGISKGFAVRYIASHLGVPMENTVAAGDAENDIAMLKAAHIGCAMANATDEVKKAADYVTVRDCEHSGVAEIIDKFIL